jgi:hypothetical protein
VFFLALQVEKSGLFSLLVNCLLLSKRTQNILQDMFFYVSGHFSFDSDLLQLKKVCFVAFYSIYSVGIKVILKLVLCFLVFSQEFHLGSSAHFTLHF